MNKTNNILGVFVLTALIAGAFLMGTSTVLAKEYKQSFGANLDGTQVVPSVTTSMTGTATFDVAIDEHDIDYSVSMSGGSASGIALYCGREGVNGTLITTLSTSGTIVESDISDAAFPNCSPNIETLSHLVQAMREGSVYIQITTAVHPEGEIRGQLHDIPTAPRTGDNGNGGNGGFNTAPIITLNGSSTISFEIGGIYNELGATATDTQDGNLTSSIIITGTVNTNATGTYPLIYSVTDSGNLSASTTRDVIVTATSTATSTSTTTPEVSNGGGSNGGSTGGSTGGSHSGGRSHSSGGGSSSGSSSSEGEVLGASTGPSLACTTNGYLIDYVKFGAHNDVYNVALLQIFLNAYEGTTLTLNGTYDQSTLEAVNAFQLKYKAEVLDPWVSLGLPENTATGYVYKTTKHKINSLVCPSFTAPFPILP